MMSTKKEGRCAEGAGGGEGGTVHGEVDADVYVDGPPRSWAPVHIVPWTRDKKDAIHRYHSWPLQALQHPPCRTPDGLLWVVACKYLHRAHVTPQMVRHLCLRLWIRMV